MRDFGIILTGGGARGAYQAGVLLALGEILKKNKLVGLKNPFTTWSGISAGAINATFCAAQAGDLPDATQRLASLWQNLTPDQVYQTDVLSVGSNSARWIRDLTFGPFLKKKLAQNLLDTHPLFDLLRDNIPFSQIEKSIDEGFIEALICSAYCYNTAKTVSFLQSKDEIEWERKRRCSRRTPIGAEHVLASCSIPLLFPPTAVGGLYFGDGGFRNTAPLGPSINLGSKKILLIGVRYTAQDDQIVETTSKPGIARIAGSMLNALFMDNLDLDLERLTHINEILAAMGDNEHTQGLEFSPVECKIVRPSENIGRIAEDHSDIGFPMMIKFLLGGLGSKKETADLASYLLFEPTFTGHLIDLGYSDLIDRKDEIENWLLS